MHTENWIFVHNGIPYYGHWNFWYIRRNALTRMRRRRKRGHLVYVANRW